MKPGWVIRGWRMRRPALALALTGPAGLVAAADAAGAPLGALSPGWLLAGGAVAVLAAGGFFRERARGRALEAENARLKGQVAEMTRLAGEEARLQALTGHLEATLQAIPDALFELDEHGLCLHVWNAHAAELGIPAGEWVGRRLNELLPPEAGGVCMEALAEAAWHGQSHGRQIRLQLAGEVRWLEVSAMAKPGTATPEFILLSRNITDRVLAMQAADAARAESDILLRQAEESRRALLSMLEDQMMADERLRQLSLAVEQSPVAIVICDLTPQIGYVNQAFVRVSGYTPAEAIGRNPGFLKSGLTPPETFREMWAALLAGRNWSGELINRRRDGEILYEQVVVSPMRRTDGVVTHYLAMKQDITENKRIGEELRRHREHLEELVARRTEELEAAKEAAEVANRAKSAFLANMSHEIRTPLNAIVGLAHMLQSKSRDANQLDKLGKIRASADHLLAVISDILDLSKIEAGRLNLEEIDFDLHDLLERSAGLMRERARAKGLELRLEPPANAPRGVRGDPTRVSQAILNYLGNAIKFTERGEITLRCFELERDAAGADEAGIVLRFEVADTGVGIAPETVERLFSAFEQADNSTTRMHGGTGLGLAITRHLAEQMGGSAGVVSTLGEGSLFWFSVRFQAAQGELLVGAAMRDRAVVPELDLRQHFAGRRVLLCEDNPINQEVAQSLLSEIGLAVVVVGNGAEGVAAVRQGGFDLVLMDLQMPVMDGLEATRQIRKLPDTAALPILALTANAFAEDRAACMKVGMSDYVSKPVDPEVLYATLLKWLPKRPEAPVVAAVPASGAEAAVHAPAAAEIRPSLHGIDGKRLETMSGGDPVRQRRLLGFFLDGHRQDVDRLKAALAAGERKAAEHVVHSLKGVSGTLGMADIHRQATAINQRIRDGEAVETLLPEVEALAPELAAVCDDIEAWLAR